LHAVIIALQVWIELCIQTVHSIGFEQCSVHSLETVRLEAASCITGEKGMLGHESRKTGKHKLIRQVSRKEGAVGCACRVEAAGA